MANTALSDVIGRDNPAHVRSDEIEPGAQRGGRTIAEWRLASSPGNRYRGPGGESWTDGYIEYTDGAREHVIVIQGGGRYAQTMAKDCHNAELSVGDRVSIDKVGEGTVSSVEQDSVRIRVPGATPEEESFNSREIQFWRVTKLSRTASLARTSGYVYELEGGAEWRSAPDDSWETVVATIDGTVVGRRRIDDAEVVVIEQGGTFYAVLPQNVTMSQATTMDRRRVDLGFGHTYVNDDRPMPANGTLIAQSEDGGWVEYWDYPGRGEWAYQGKRVTVHSRGGNNRRARQLGAAPTRFGHDDELLDEWIDEWVLLTTGQVGLVQTTRGDQLSVDIAAGPLDHIDDAGWHTVLVPPSMVRRKLNWDEIQRLRTPDGWTGGHTPRLSSATAGARTMARVKARFIDDNTAQFKKDQVVYVDEQELKSGRSRMWISKDPEGLRGAYGLPSDVALLSARPAAQQGRPSTPRSESNRGAAAMRAGATGRVMRRYQHGGQSWLLVVTGSGKTVSWPAAEARTMGSATNTRFIAGHSITLRVGVRYRASRPMYDGSQKVFPVTIAPIDGSEAPSVVINGLSYDQANVLLSEFNNGASSFEGRVWMAQSSAQH